MEEIEEETDRPQREEALQEKRQRTEKSESGHCMGNKPVILSIL